MSLLWSGLFCPRWTYLKCVFTLVWKGWEKLHSVHFILKSVCLTLMWHRVIFWSFVLTLFTLICLIWKIFGGNWFQYNVCPSWTWMLVNSKCIINLFLFKGKARIIHVESKREHKYVPVSLNMSEIIGSSKYAQSDSCTKMKTLCEKASFLRRGCRTIYSQNTGIA